MIGWIHVGAGRGDAAYLSLLMWLLLRWSFTPYSRCSGTNQGSPIFLDLQYSCQDWSVTEVCSKPNEAQRLIMESG